MFSTRGQWHRAELVVLPDYLPVAELGVGQVLRVATGVGTGDLNLLLGLGETVGKPCTSCERLSRPRGPGSGAPRLRLCCELLGPCDDVLQSGLHGAARQQLWARLHHLTSFLV
eukprot:5493847-Pyramimonas_sp.AAC.1